MTPLYLTNVRYVDWRTFAVHAGHLRVEPGPFGGCAPVDELPADADRIDCAGKYVTRAFAVAHHHIYSALARGMPAPAKSPANFLEILQYIWWNLDRQLDADMIRASALATAVDAARAGTTFIIDHHASPHAIRGSLEIIAEALDSVGLGHLLCYELSDRDGLEVREAGLAETEAYLATRPGLVGLHASFTVSDALLAAAVKLAERTDSGIHIHVAEDLADEKHCLEHHGKRVAARLADAGALQFSRTLLAHCVHLDEAERSLVAQSPAWVVQNAESNQNNAIGRFSPRGLGSRILIGTDGMHSDAAGSARAAFLDGQPGLSMLEVYQRLRGVHAYLAAHRVPGDGENNLVVLDYEPPTPVTADNWLGHFFYGLNRSHVHTVLSQGRPILRDRVLVGADEARIMAQAREQALRLWARL